MGYNIRKIPTAVSDFDAIIHGGLPEGSVVLLLGDMGAGQQEFVYTSASKLSIVKERPEVFDSYLGHYCDVAGLPEKICYVSFARSKEDVLREIGLSFNREFHDALQRKLVFKDLSATGCSILTLGQYLAPSPDHAPVIRYVPPEEFDRLAEKARKIGFKDVFSGPFVRSSYRAEEIYRHET